MAHEFVDIGASTRVDVTALLASAAPPPLADDAYPVTDAHGRPLWGDQRTMLPGGLGGRDEESGDEWGPCGTAEDVTNVWVRHLRKHQRMEPRIDEQNRSVVPHLNAGRWVADCPECGCGMACWDRNPYACCLGWRCGRIYKVMWQLPQQRAAVMRLLAGWPEGNRNWDAHKGETLEELKIQGVLMAGVEPVQRNALLVAENVTVPDELTDPAEYLDRLRQQRRKAFV